LKAESSGTSGKEDTSKVSAENSNDVYLKYTSVVIANLMTFLQLPYACRGNAKEVTSRLARFES